MKWQFDLLVIVFDDNLLVRVEKGIADKFIGILFAMCFVNFYFVHFYCSLDYRLIVYFSID